MIVKNEFKSTMNEYNNLKEVSDTLKNDELTDEDYFEAMDMTEEEINEYKKDKKEKDEELEKSLEELRKFEEESNITEEDKQKIIETSNIEYYIEELNKKITKITEDEKLSDYEKNKKIEKCNIKIADIKDSIYLYKLEGMLEYYIKPPKNIKKIAIDILRRTKKITVNNDIKNIEENIIKIINDEQYEKNIKNFVKSFYYMITKKTLSEISLYVFFINYNISMYLNDMMYQNNKIIFKESLLRILKKF